MIYQPSVPEIQYTSIAKIRWGWRKVERSVLRHALIEQSWQAYIESDETY